MNLYTAEENLIMNNQKAEEEHPSSVISLNPPYQHHDPLVYQKLSMLLDQSSSEYLIPDQCRSSIYNISEYSSVLGRGPKLLHSRNEIYLSDILPPLGLVNP